MSPLTSADIINAWVARLKIAVDNPAPGGFDGRNSLAEWLADSAVDQAERIFLIPDATPIERRDLGEAERLVQQSGCALLEAWAALWESIGVRPEEWAVRAATTAMIVYKNRLDELGPSIHTGGRA